MVYNWLKGKITMDDHALAQQTIFDLKSYPFICNPYPTYKEMLTHSPIYRCPKYGFYYLFRYQHITSILKNSNASSKRAAAFVSTLDKEQQSMAEPLTQSFALMALFNDPPEHTSMRKLIVRSLSNRVMNGMTSTIEGIANQLINQFIDKKHCDLIKDFAYPLPAIIISQLLGVPTTDIDKIKAWSDDIADFLSDQTKIEIVTKATQTVVEMNDYFSFLLKKFRNQPDDNFLCKLLKIQQQYPEHHDGSLIANAILLIFGGHETTTNLIGNGWMTLLKHPSQLQTLEDHLENAIEECLRYEAPFQRIGRVATNPIQIDNELIEKGQRILLILGAANRDPQHFKQPDQFDINRPKNTQIAFGHGIHFCPGASLAKLEARIAFSLLKKRVGHWQLVDSEPQWQHNLSLRGMVRCPLQA